MPGFVVDLSHTIRAGLITYKGLPAPLICDYLSRADSRQNYAGGTEFQIGRIDMVSNTGTYIDCPFHRYADGKDLSETALERLAEGRRGGSFWVTAGLACALYAGFPETAYLDSDRAYASNEIAINWNAPLVYLAGAVEALH